MDTDRYMYILSVTHDDIVISYFIHMSFSGDKQLTKNLIFLLEQNPRIRRTGLQRSR